MTTKLYQVSHARGCVEYIATLARAFAYLDPSRGDVEDVDNNLAEIVSLLDWVEMEWQAEEDSKSQVEATRLRFEEFKRKIVANKIYQPEYFI